MAANKKLLYFVTEDWYFCSHRLALAKLAQQAGFDISVLTRVNRHGHIIHAAGMQLIPLDVDRGGVNPLREIQTLWQVWQVYRQVKPDLVHHVALKPVLYGGVVALFMPRLKIVNLLAGLGVIFSSEQLKARLIQPVVNLLFRILFRRRNTCTIVQNREDYALLLNRFQVPASALRLIKGSGVDTEQFYPSPEPTGRVTVALVSRLLWDKGIGEYVAAIKLLKQKGLQFNALLLGEPDKESMASICPGQLQIWNNEGDVTCLGHIENISQFWTDAHIAVLPSFYGEGVPRCLIEAAASGRPIVTTNIAGCNEIVEDGLNGYLVPIKDAQALAFAMEKLLLDADLRKVMGLAGRKKVENEFSNSIVLEQMLRIYRQAFWS